MARSGTHDATGREVVTRRMSADLMTGTSLCDVSTAFSNANSSALQVEGAIVAPTVARAGTAQLTIPNKRRL